MLVIEIHTCEMYFVVKIEFYLKVLKFCYQNAKYT